ncbi:Uncharacterized conserved protein, contains ankyrin and BTB/POZ domains [Phaffia rhodozyma]|uniref:Uncharacterized conserved protein, contains ankyrin and BTB/POZ domains n=1 Tax=Phaffia rhodozyma TaxID=264483 RepID=A0A0F7ST23_PHARH|nr:Uncharacterized conserved protein, contains ankyrin and BTB/POZ domains [Phaffia rhodozyma]
MGCPLHNAFLLLAKKEFKRLLERTSPNGGPNGSNSSFNPNGNLGGSSSSTLNWTGPSSGPKSWQPASVIHGALSSSSGRVDINSRDRYGRTILHLVASSPQESTAVDYLKLLLDLSPKNGLNVNLQDIESGWTALHRALYAGNLEVARILLLDDRIDPKVKDGEGLTCYDLYNSTVEGTNPAESTSTKQILFTWGTNRNCVLGSGDGGDRILPEKVHLVRAEKKIHPKAAQFTNQEETESDSNTDEEDESSEEDTKEETIEIKSDIRRFDPVGVKDVVMAKLHTAVITTESSSNLNLCGFGSGGRLGRSIHTQYDMAPIPSFPQQIVSIALGQDHTLALNAHGHIYSWGLNKFSVLGYPVEAPALGSKFQTAPEEAIQTTPRRIVGGFKKEKVLGVVASRCSSACWTEDSVWTWGYNNGHLGYDSGPNSAQIYPRKVAGAHQTVIGLAITDYALACLLSTHEVLVFYHGTSFKIQFPNHRRFAESATYRPPGSQKKLQVVKITSCGITFACLTSLGDVYTFSLPNPLVAEREAVAVGSTAQKMVKPQRAWALRKRFTAVRDVALGSDGMIIVCTQSGHVFVRTRNNKGNVSSNPTGFASGSKTYKFQRIPYLQRVIKVAANESGAFAAVRVDASPKPVDITGNSVGEDLMLLIPHVRRWQESRQKETFLPKAEEHTISRDDLDGDLEPYVIQSDIKVACRLTEICEEWQPASAYPPLIGIAGSDCVLRTAGRDTPVHRTIIAARSPVIRRLLSELVAVKKTPSGGNRGVWAEVIEDGRTRIHLPKVDHYSILLLVQYLYTDDFPAVWDPRVGASLKPFTWFLGKNTLLGNIRVEMQSIADLLGLVSLSASLSRLTKNTPAPTLASDMARLFSTSYSCSETISSLSPFLRPNVIVQLADKTVACQEAVLRSRSPFFAGLFEDPCWTLLRRDEAGVVKVDLTYMKWSVVRLVFRYLYEGGGAELFDYQHQDNVDSFLDFVFDVLEVATELMLDRLVLVCSSVVLRHITIHNACGLLADASFFHANALRESIELYISQNMETMLESHLLDNMPSDILANLSSYVHRRQGLRLPISRSGVLLTAAMERQAEWLALQDVPKPYLRPAKSALAIHRSPGLSPIEVTSTLPPPPRRSSSTTIIGGTPVQSSPAFKSQLRSAAEGDDDMFQMDEDQDVSSISHLVSNASIEGAEESAGSSVKRGWTSQNDNSKLNMRSIIAAESAAASRPRPPPTPVRPPITPESQNTSFRLSQKDRKKLQATPTAPVSTPAPTSLTSGGSSSPWRMTTPRTNSISISPASIGLTMASTSASRPAMSIYRKDSAPAGSTSVFPRLASGSSSPKPSTIGGGGGGITPSVTPSSTISFPKLGSNASGTVIVPTRAPATSNSSFITRKVSSDPAWTVPSFGTPIPEPSAPATSSFAHIQFQQQEVRESRPAPTKTLLEIQQEEAASVKAKQEEEDFLKWWEANAAAVAAGEGSAEPGEGKRTGGKRAGKAKPAKGGGRKSAGEPNEGQKTTKEAVETGKASGSGGGARKKGPPKPPSKGPSQDQPFSAPRTNPASPARPKNLPGHYNANKPSGPPNQSKASISSPGVPLKRVQSNSNQPGRSQLASSFPPPPFVPSGFTLPPTSTTTLSASSAAFEPSFLRKT